jgi:hypothetical protein
MDFMNLKHFENNDYKNEKPSVYGDEQIPVWTDE